MLVIFERRTLTSGALRNNSDRLGIFTMRQNLHSRSFSSSASIRKTVTAVGIEATLTRPRIASATCQARQLTATSAVKPNRDCRRRDPRDDSHFIGANAYSRQPQLPWEFATERRINHPPLPARLNGSSENAVNPGGICAPAVNTCG